MTVSRQVERKHRYIEVIVSTELFYLRLKVASPAPARIQVHDDVQTALFDRKAYVVCHAFDEDVSGAVVPNTVDSNLGTLRG